MAKGGRWPVPCLLERERVGDVLLGVTTPCAEQRA